MTHEQAQVAYVWSYGQAGYPPGSFVDSLIGAIMNADATNREKLRLAFPEYVAAVEHIREHGAQEYVR